jgi:alkanesulfonate monooxygenase SsuD/methylene tetrahydromethanopterin reductase-like flavin-dependent oxidoreductase (luciferase family)
MLLQPCHHRGVFTLRFDFRRAERSPATMGELYAASLDMTEWAERNGALGVIVSQHHGSADGYLPSPIVMASAMTARTTSTPITVAALLLLMYDPVKLAEDIAVLHHLSQGRVTYVIGLGYRPDEFAMFGIDPSRRGAEMEERLDVLLRALAGERFEWRGRPVAVTPTIDAPGPFLAYGGGSVAAARRAGRFGLSFFPEGDDPALEPAYRAECQRVGTTPGMVMAGTGGTPTSLHVAADVDAAWDELGPYLLHDAVTYAEWLGPDSIAASYSGATTVDALREENGAYRIVDPDGAVALCRSGRPLLLQPLCGGLPPESAWRSLRLIESEVLPALS